jgi:hypothetical protein
MNRRDDPLYNVEAFFKLPVEESLEPMLSPISKSDQPTGFVDDAGSVWIPVTTDDGTLKRQRL